MSLRGRWGFPLARTTLLVGITTYVVVLNWTYVRFVAARYDYFGSGLNDIPWGYFAISFILALIPGFWMPLTLTRPSHLLFYVQYFVIFIPSAFLLYQTSNPQLTPEVAFSIVVSMFVGITILQAAYLIPLSGIPRVATPPFLFWGTLLLGVGFLTAYLIATLGGHMRFASLVQIYSARSELKNVVQATGSRFGFYAQTWLAGFLLPLAFAVGLFARRRWILVTVALGYLLLFGVTASKTTLFAMIYMPTIYAVLSRGRRQLVAIIAFGLTALLILGAGLEVTVGGVPALWFTAIVNFRTFAVPSLLLSQYAMFFQNHPLTHLAHVTGISLLATNPYQAEISETIGSYYYSIPIVNNAGFWAGDGIAGFGVPGIVLMSVLCAVVFRVLDEVARPFNPRFVAVALSFIATSFGNASLFTTLWTGGLGLLMLTLLLAPRKGLFGTPPIRAPAIGVTRHSPEVVS